MPFAFFFPASVAVAKHSQAAKLLNKVIQSPGSILTSANRKLLQQCFGLPSLEDLNSAIALFSTPVEALKDVPEDLIRTASPLVLHYWSEAVAEIPALASSFPDSLKTLLGIPTPAPPMDWAEVEDSVLRLLLAKQESLWVSRADALRMLRPIILDDELRDAINEVDRDQLATEATAAKRADGSKASSLKLKQGAKRSLRKTDNKGKSKTGERVRKGTPAKHKKRKPLSRLSNVLEDSAESLSDDTHSSSGESSSSEESRVLEEWIFPAGDAKWLIQSGERNYVDLLQPNDLCDGMLVTQVTLQGILQVVQVWRRALWPVDTDSAAYSLPSGPCWILNKTGFEAFSDTLSGQQWPGVLRFPMPGIAPRGLLLKKPAAGGAADGSRKVATHGDECTSLTPSGKRSFTLSPSAPSPSFKLATGEFEDYVATSTEKVLVRQANSTGLRNMLGPRAVSRLPILLGPLCDITASSVTYEVLQRAGPNLQSLPVFSSPDRIRQFLNFLFITEAALLASLGLSIESFFTGKIRNPMELAQALRNLIEAIFKVILPVIFEGVIPAAVKSTFFLTRGIEGIVSRLQFEPEGFGALETDFQLLMVNRALATASGILNSQESVLLKWSHDVLTDKVCEALEIKDWMLLYTVWQAKTREARKLGARHDAKEQNERSRRNRDKVAGKGSTPKPKSSKSNKGAATPNQLGSPTPTAAPPPPTKPCVRTMLVHFNSPGAQPCTLSKCRYSHDMTGFSNDQMRAALTTFKDGTNKTFLLTAIPP